MKILYPPYVTSFDALQRNDKKEAKIEGEEMLCAILYLENSYKPSVYNLKRRVDNDYI